MFNLRCIRFFSRINWLIHLYLLSWVYEKHVFLSGATFFLPRDTINILDNDYHVLLQWKNDWIRWHNPATLSSKLPNCKYLWLFFSYQKYQKIISERKARNGNSLSLYCKYLHLFFSILFSISFLFFVNITIIILPSQTQCRETISYMQGIRWVLPKSYQKKPFHQLHHQLWLLIFS